MNTSFHMTNIKHAYSSLALTSNGTILHARIGFDHLEIPMGSTQALATAMQDLRREMIVAPEEVIRVCSSSQASSRQPETRIK